MKSVELCPCGSGKPFSACCGRYLDGWELAPGPEALMRSRYSAFARGRDSDIRYLVETHHPSTRGAHLERELSASVESVESWDGLRVVRASASGDHGEVEFEARFQSGGQRGVLRERSSFLLESGRWYYVNGTVG